jgi:hypothetical protein
LRFANAEASGGTEVGAEDVAVSGAGIEDLNAETGAGAGDVPKTRVDDELAPSMTEGEGLTPKTVGKPFSCAWLQRLGLVLRLGGPFGFFNYWLVFT